MNDKTAQVVGGLYELCIGVLDLDASIEYFNKFGFKAEKTVDLSKEKAISLYGVESSARVCRLLHGNVDHGFIRLMEWENPINDGLGLSSMMSVGNRWSNNHTLQLGRIHSHALLAKRQGAEIDICPPGFADFGGDGSPHKPFEAVINGVYEFSVKTPLYRQCFFDRIDYPSPNYGTIDPDCLFQTSQVTHCGLLCATDDHSVFDFYDKCLGLKRILDVEQPYQHIHVLNDLFDIPEGKSVHALAFDDPEAGEGLNKKSGRILIFNFGANEDIPNLQDRSRAGVLGYSHYTWRVRDLNQLKKDAIETGAKSVGEITEDEFGCLSWACTTPDGYYWQFIEAHK